MNERIVLSALIILAFSSCDVHFMGIEGNPHDQLILELSSPEKVERGEAIQLSLTVENRSTKAVDFPHACQIHFDAIRNGGQVALSGLSRICHPYLRGPFELKPGEELKYTFTPKAEVYAGNRTYEPASQGIYEISTELFSGDALQRVATKIKVL